MLPKSFHSVFELERLPSRLFEDVDDEDPLNVGSMLSLIFCFKPSPAQSIWFISVPSVSTDNITCFPCPRLALLLVDELVDVGDDWRSGKLPLLTLWTFNSSSIFSGKSHSLLVEVDTTFPVFSSIFTWELTFLIALELLLVDAASESVMSRDSKG